MPKNKLPSNIKKNLLDLNYNKYLQYFNTSIIILFTYIIGVFIAFITKQIDYKNPNQLVLVAFISMVIISMIITLMLKFRKHLAEIPKELKKLRF